MPKTALSQKTLEQMARRYLYWRNAGVAVSDAPVDYLYNRELDKYTDKEIKQLEKIKPPR